MNAPVTIEANSRHLRLARRALRAAITHLRNAENRTSMDADTQRATRELWQWLEVEVATAQRLEREANAHLEAMRAKRRAA